MTGSLLDKSLVYVTGKGGVGKTTVAAAIGLAAPRAGAGRSSARSPTRTASRARSRARACARRSRSSSAEDLWAITIDPEAALARVALAAARRRPPVRLLAHSHAFQYFVAAAPGRARSS